MASRPPASRIRPALWVVLLCLFLGVYLFQLGWYAKRVHFPLERVEWRAGEHTVIGEAWHQPVLAEIPLLGLSDLMEPATIKYCITYRNQRYARTINDSPSLLATLEISEREDAIVVHDKDHPDWEEVVFRKSDVQTALKDRVIP